MTWDSVYQSGCDKRTAAQIMGCSPRTAEKRLAEAAERARNERARHQRDVTRLVTTATKPATQWTSFPPGIIELSDRIHDAERNRVYGDVTNKQRDMVANGLPVGELTQRMDGESIATLERQQGERMRRRMDLQQAA